MIQDTALEELQREISERPTAKQVEDLRKQVKILQVGPQFYLPDFPLARFQSDFHMNYESFFLVNTPAVGSFLG